MEFSRLMKILLFLVAAGFTCMDISLDAALAVKYKQNASKIENEGTPSVEIFGPVTTNNIDLIFFVLTTTWILLGGFVQAIVTIVKLCKRDPIVNLIPKRVQVLMMITAPILMAPVIVNLFGAYVVFRNQENAEEDVMR